MSSTLSSSLAGRKRESSVWTYFEYDCVKKACKCTVINEKTKAACGQLIANKNTTNMKKHVQSLHPDIFKKIAECDAARAENILRRSQDSVQP
jgi:hypothetical protein